MSASRYMGVNNLPRVVVRSRALVGWKPCSRPLDRKSDALPLRNFITTAPQCPGLSWCPGLGRLLASTALLCMHAIEPTTNGPPITRTVASFVQAPAQDQGRSQDFEFRGLKPMASAERKPIAGVWGRARSGVQGQSPWSGVQGGKVPLKLKAFWSLDVQRSRQI